MNNIKNINNKYKEVIIQTGTTNLTENTDLNNQIIGHKFLKMSGHKLQVTRRYKIPRVTCHRKSQVSTRIRSQEVTSSYKLEITGSRKFLQVKGHKKSQVPTSSYK